MYHIGDVIRTTRLEQKVSQEELCFGICSVSTLSRIENGTQAPNRGLIEALLARLGKSMELYMFMSSTDEIEIHNLKQIIRKHIVYREYGEAERILKRLELKKGLNKTCIQFIGYTKATLLHWKYDEEVDLNKVLKMYEDALKLTYPSYDHTNLLNRLLSRDEITIINNIAILHKQLGQENLAVEEYYAIKEYYEKKVVDLEEKATVYVGILSNLSKTIGLQGKHNECIELCDIGIKCCINFGRLTNMPILLLNKGCSLIELGKINEGIPIMQEAYFIFKAVGKYDSCKRIEDYFIDNGINLNYINSACSGSR